MRLTAAKYLTRILLMLSSLLHVPRHCKSLKAFLFKKYLFVKSYMFMHYILICFKSSFTLSSGCDLNFQIDRPCTMWVDIS